MKDEDELSEGDDFLDDDESLDLDMDLDLDDDSEWDEDSEAEVGEPEEAAEAEPEADPEPKPEVEPEEPIHAEMVDDVAMAIQEVPLHVVVEAGRLKMSLRQLLDLAPGNLLELGITPESGVNLVVSGKVVGRGELIRVGETLGVRILEKG